MAGKSPYSHYFVGAGAGCTEDLRTMPGGGAGSSSSYYYSTSGSSASSSVENISTSSSIENGDQLTITFFPNKSPSSQLQLQSHSNLILSSLLPDIFELEEELKNFCVPSPSPRDRVVSSGSNNSNGLPSEGVGFEGRRRGREPSSSLSISSTSSINSGPPPPIWYSDIGNGGGASSFTLKPSLGHLHNNEDECVSSSSSCSHFIQNFAGDGILLKSLEKGGEYEFLIARII